MSDPYLGQILAVAISFAPRGWALCNGQLLPINQNAALYNLLGNTYGGSASAGNFALPNLQGRYPRGAGQGNGLSQVQLGQTGGAESIYLPTITSYGTLVPENLPPHTHPAAFSGISTTSPFTSTFGVTTSPGQSTPQSGGSLAQGSNSGTGQANIFLPQGSGGSTVQLNGGSGSVTSTPSGSVQVNAQTGTTAQQFQVNSGGVPPIGVLDPYLGINYIIALQGIYPTQN